MAYQLCGQIGANTGGVKCAVSPDKAINFAIWGGTLTPAEQLTQAAMKTVFLADSKLIKSDPSKLFLLPIRQGIENKKEANVEQTFSNGLKLTAREGLPGYRFSYLTSQAQVKELRKFNNQVVPVIIQDAKKNVWGTADASGNFVGRQAILFFEGLMHATDDNVAGVGYVDIFFIDAIENYDDQVFVNVDFNFSTTLKALLDVQIYEKSASVSNVLAISGKVNVANLAVPYDIYADSGALFTTAANFTAKNMATGASIAITTLAANAGGWGDMTLNSAAYTALASGDKVGIYGITPTALDAAGFAGVELLMCVHTKP